MTDATNARVIFKSTGDGKYQILTSFLGYCMNFQEKYKNLYNFFGAWFPDADFEDLTDKEIVVSFKKVTSNEIINEALGEISLLVKDESFPLDEITDSTNIHFEDKTDCIN